MDVGPWGLISLEQFARVETDRRDLVADWMWAMKERRRKQKWISGWCNQQWERWRRLCNDIGFIGIKASLGFPGGSVSKESTCSARDLGSIPGLRRFPGGGHGNPLQYSVLENPHGQRTLAGYSPWGCKELDMTEQLNTYSTAQRKNHKRN